SSTLHALPWSLSGARAVPPPASAPLFPYTPLFRSLRRPPRRHAAPRRGVAAAALPAPAPRGPRRDPVHGGRDRRDGRGGRHGPRSEEHTSELQSREKLVCRLLLGKKKERHGRCVTP